MAALKEPSAVDEDANRPTATEEANKEDAGRTRKKRRQAIHPGEQEETNAGGAAASGGATADGPDAMLEPSVMVTPRVSPCPRRSADASCSAAGPG